MAKTPNNFRNASSGRFVKPSSAAGNPGGHVKEPRTASKNSPSDPYRSAESGRYVTEKYGKANPTKVVRER